ncbi:MAG: dihydrofolate reductase [Marinilabiliales bacterium]|nr:dihydrofolate reductase [Marinilabiliales bacterium]
MPKDLKHFKETTTGHFVIQGRKTYESFGKPLPNRTNVIITRDKNYKAEGCIVVNSLQEALGYCNKREGGFYYWWW